MEKKEKRGKYGKAPFDAASQIADFFFANPTATRGDVLANFGKLWQASTRTIDRLIAEAKAINGQRAAKQEAAKVAQLEVAAKEKMSAKIASQEEVLAVFSSILRGASKKIPDRVSESGEVLSYRIEYPTYSAIISAGMALQKIPIYHAMQNAQSGDAGEPSLTREEISKLIEKL